MRVRGTVIKSHLVRDRFLTLDPDTWQKDVERGLARVGASMMRRTKELQEHGSKLEERDRLYLESQKLRETELYDRLCICRAIAEDRLCAEALTEFLEANKKAAVPDPSGEFDQVAKFAPHARVRGAWRVFEALARPLALRILTQRMVVAQGRERELADRLAG